MDLMGSCLEQIFHALGQVRRITQIWVVTFISMEFLHCLRSFLMYQWWRLPTIKSALLLLFDILIYSLLDSLLGSSPSIL